MSRWDCRHNPLHARLGQRPLEQGPGCFRRITVSLMLWVDGIPNLDRTVGSWWGDARDSHRLARLAADQ